MNKKLIITIVIIIQVCFIWQCVINPVRSGEAEEKTLASEDTSGTVVDESGEGQEVLPPEEKQEALQTEENQEAADAPADGTDEQTEPELSSLSVLEEFEKVIMEGQQEVQDTPWSVNSGLVTLDSGEECLLLTPNTGFMTPYLAVREGTIDISFCIFEEVREKSDGAGLLLQIHDMGGVLLQEENIPVDAGQEWQEYSYEISGFQDDKIRVRIMCNNGGNDDDVCDWVMIRKAVVSGEKVE